MKIFSVISFLFLSFLHDIHISKCDMYYVDTEKALQITMHIFIDDLEIGLANNGIENQKIGTYKEKDSANVFIAEYIEDHFKIKVDDSLYSYQFLGKELSEDLIAIWCYLEIENVDIQSKISIENDMFLDLYDDQKNIIQLKSEGNLSFFDIFERGNSKSTVLK